MYAGKNYLDGSVPCGFQRTLLIGSDGYLMVNEKSIGITTICIEEDAARKIKEDGKTITYRLDRLGIPLIEVVTDPDINTPDECMMVALRLGMLLRSTGLMKRGLGTIRQDINVSIEGGARVEIKGVQKLEWIPSLIENEVRRQLNLLKVRNELRVRNFTKEDLSNEFKDVTKIFKKTTCKFMKDAINEGQFVFAVKIPKIAGVLGGELIENYRFGKEIAQKVSAITGIKGIIHSDENMSTYGFKKPEITALKKELKMEEKDLFIMVVADELNAIKALKITIDRIEQALEGVPNETRKALEDCSTEFIRELHGGARLYPDTDSVPIRLKKDYIKDLGKNLPELPWDLAVRLREKFELDPITIDKLILQGNTAIFEEIVNKFKINPTLVATTLLETLKSIKRAGFENDNITDQHLRELFELIQKQEIAKEAIEELLLLIAKDPSLSIKDAREQLELKSLSEDELNKVIQEILDKNKTLIKEKGERAFSPLMGEVMKTVRGKIDGKIIADQLKYALDNYSPEEKAENTIKEVNEFIIELFSNDKNILEEKRADAFDILFIKLKRRFKGQIDEELLTDRLKTAIGEFLQKR